MRRFSVLFAALALLLVGVRASEAGTIAQHAGSTDPTTEGFTGSNVVGSSTTGPLSNDQGFPAWSITGASQASQFGYTVPGLTGSEQADIASQGFTLTLVARVLQNGMAPAYTTSDPVIIAAAYVGYAGVRWEIDLGLNSHGDTVVVLPNTLYAQGPGGSVQSFGASYTLTGSGSTYQTYQLFYDPTTQVAELSVDGVTVLTDYTGQTRFFTNNALLFGAASGGQANFNLVQVQTGAVPEPTSVALLIAGLGIVIGHERIRRRRRA